jgi:DNA-directed RNA polymerase specialized sigma24 family protein
LIRDTNRHSHRRTHVGTPDEDPDVALCDTVPGQIPTPEELASHRERLAIVARVAARLVFARLKFVEDLPEQEIARRQGLTRYSVAGHVKRTRKALRRALKEPEYLEPTPRRSRVAERPSSPHASTYAPSGVPLPSRRRPGT